MKLFAAPPKSAATRLEDFCRTTEGELVSFWDCPCDDYECHKHMFTGFESMRSTNLAVVTERYDIDEEVLHDMIVRDLGRRGWLTPPIDQEWLDFIEKDVEDVVSTASYFDVGTLLERTPEGVALRQKRMAA